MSLSNHSISLVGLALTCGLMNLVGCQPRREVPPTATTPPDIPPAPIIVPPANQQAENPSPDQKPEEKPAESPLQVTLATDKDSYARGATIQFTITVHNTSKIMQALQFRSGQSFDITATPEGKSEAAWRWSHDKFFTMALRSERLRPDEKKTYTATWDQTDNQGNVVARGSYVMEAKITANGGIKAAPLTLKLAD